MIRLLLAVADAATQTAPAEPLPSYEGAFLKMIITFVAVIVGIVGTIWLMRRLSGGRLMGGAGRSIQIIERKALSPKTTLYVIEVNGKQAVIAESQLEVKRIMEIEPPTSNE